MQRKGLSWVQSQGVTSCVLCSFMFKAYKGTALLFASLCHNVFKSSFDSVRVSGLGRQSKILD